VADSNHFINRYKNISVFGAGKSGLAVIKRLKRSDVFLSESMSEIDPKTLKTLKKHKIPYELGGHTIKAIESADLVVLSPGVPTDIPILKMAKRRNLPVISEVELAYYFIRKPIIAVTGTNGKTTTTALIGKMLKDFGYKVAVAGNIGYPLISVKDEKLDYIVAEISSYQLETIDKFKPWISIILNITPDHLTRHRTMDEYAKIKAKIFKNQKKTDHLIFNQDDPLVSKISRNAKCDRLSFSQQGMINNGLFLKNNRIYYKNEKIIDVDSIMIKGRHNIENSMAAIAAAVLAKVSTSSINKTLRTFKGVEHRIEFIKKVDGVSFYNDSKATNPDSTMVAIKAIEPRHNIVLILGGRDKMTDISDMCKLIKQKVKDVVLLGEAKHRFKNCLMKFGFNKVYDATDLIDAVKYSFKLARPGDAVLLSPACASFDMFSNFEERGKVFKKIVASI